MKKILLLALATVLTLSLMTGCRNKDSKAESAVDDAITTISEGLDDMTGDNTSDRNNTNDSENNSDESNQGNTNSRNRRGIHRH